MEDSGGTLNGLIDAVDTFAAATDGDDAWRRAVALVEDEDANALNIAECMADGTPVWFRSSMSEAWLNDYFDQTFHHIDPLLLAGCRGERVLRMTDGRIDGIVGDTAPERALCDQIVSWDYRVIDFCTYTAPEPGSFKAIAIARAADAPAPDRRAQLRAAVIAAAIGPPETRDSPGATPLMDPALSTRERDVLRYLAAGHRNDAIAFRMKIAEVTVRAHAAQARRKLGAATREQAIALAIRSGQLRL
ncbi:helix-turn-helix transcriptional regulator [uncultured Jannaschia sp.]|uniref:helix-turn-helix transcriptional regulator n=1 Tax=uncultured Jannaschia sp. TaxID=293347 RepID=UPI00262D1ECB|nr:helix-turn-helix transcriptional regulator [uncultured Jannaschia sp.]